MSHGYSGEFPSPRWRKPHSLHIHTPVSRFYFICQRFDFLGAIVWPLPLFISYHRYSRQNGENYTAFVGNNPYTFFSPYPIPGGPLQGFSGYNRMRCYYLSLYILICHPCTASVISIGGWGYLPWAESSGALVTATIRSHDTLCIICHIYMYDRIWFSYSFQYPSLHPSIYYSPSLSSSDSSVPISLPPYDAACPTLISMISREGCSNHCLDRRSPGFRSTARHKFVIVQVAMYCATMLWRRAIYAPISSIPTVASAAPMGAYTHVPYRWSLGPVPTILCTAWWWKTLRGFSSGGSLPTSWTQTESPLAPPPHKISLMFSNLLPPFPKSSLVVHTFPSPSVGSVSPPDNRLQRTTTFFPSTWIEKLPSAVSHTPRRTSPSVPLYPQQPASVASSPTRADTLMMSGAPDWMTHVVQTCHTGGTRGGVDSPPPGLLCCTEGVSDKSGGIHNTHVTNTESTLLK